jgi:hypothetical protein
MSTEKSNGGFHSLKVGKFDHSSTTPPRAGGNGRRMHRNARARAWRDPLQPDGPQEHVALCAIRSETRSAKWARGSRSQTHRRASKGGFTQDDVKVRRPRARSQPSVLIVLLF